MQEAEVNGQGSLGLAVPDDELHKHISPLGTLGLPRLLDAKRFEWGIPDEAFTHQAAFKKLLIWQIPLSKSDTYEGTSIIKTQQTKSRHLQEAHRGVVVSAGMTALDMLRSNGMDLGHTVNICRVAPFRMQFTTIGAVPLHLLIIHVGDVVDSEDLATALKTRVCRIRQDDDTGQHYFIDENGKQWKPLDDGDTPEE